jgi:hypothetical protein
MKHFAMYSVEAGRNGAGDDFNISLRDLDEYYFVPLKACVTQADIGAFMCSCTSHLMMALRVQYMQRSAVWYLYPDLMRVAHTTTTAAAAAATTTTTTSSPAAHLP